MSKKVFFFLLLLVSFNSRLIAQSAQVYNPAANAASDLDKALKKAAEENKHVFIQIGGNWCPWCLAFNKLSLEDDSVKTALNKDYVVMHLNYSKENKNEALLAQLEYPQRFGFPVFVILDSKGKRLHTQNSGYLEAGKGHDPKKVIEFLKGWSPEAISPHTYLKALGK